MKLAENLREQVPGLRVMSHFGGGNFKKQFKRADKVGAAVAIVLVKTKSLTGLWH